MPNLRSLKLNIDGKVPDFNLASLLSGNLALQTAHIKLIGEGITGGRHKANVQGSGTALRHELQENLPMRLQSIVLQGENIENIHPAAFKVSLYFQIFLSFELFQRRFFCYLGSTFSRLRNNFWGMCKY